MTSPDQRAEIHRPSSAVQKYMLAAGAAAYLLEHSIDTTGDDRTPVEMPYSTASFRQQHPNHLVT